MIAENQLLFAFARQNFTDSHLQAVEDICRRHNIDWDLIFSTARAHGVAPLIFAHLQQPKAGSLDVPSEVFEKFRLCTYRNALRRDKLQANTEKALSYFQERGIDVMLIKGSALDLLVYAQPWYKISDDVDLVLKLSREAISDDEQREIMAYLHNTGVEFDYYTHHDVVLNGVLPIDFDRIWEDADVFDLDGFRVYLMGPEDMLISVCTNSCRKRYFRLKSLCDTAEIIATYPELDWDGLVQRAKADHCGAIVYAALRAAEMTVGCDLPPAVLSDLGVGAIQARAIDYLVKQISQNMPLSSLYPYSGGRLFARKVNAALALPYVTYRPYQLGRRLWRLMGR
jgi:hypothetical protein